MFNKLESLRTSNSCFVCPLILFILICNTAHAEPFAGASGMAQISDNAYLCVQDTKADRPGSRIGILTVDTEKGGYDYLPLEPDWEGELPHDLESAFALRDRPGELLLCESGAYENWTTHEYHIGRIFHIRLTAAAESWDFELLGTIPIPEHLHEIEGMFLLPVFNPEDIQFDRDLFGDVDVARDALVQEAMAAAGLEEAGADEAALDWGAPGVRQPQPSDLPGRDLAYLILCTRGGDEAYEPASFHENVIDLKNHELRELRNGQGIDISVPPQSDPFQRGCSDVYLDRVGILWIVSCSDLGDNGPFNSRIYRYGQYDIERGYGMSRSIYDNTSWFISGLKVEALCGSVMEGSTLCYATDDEGFGGIWRSLGAATSLR